MFEGREQPWWSVVVLLPSLHLHNAHSSSGLIHFGCTRLFLGNVMRFVHFKGVLSIWTLINTGMVLFRHSAAIMRPIQKKDPSTLCFASVFRCGQVCYWSAGLLFKGLYTALYLGTYIECIFNHILHVNIVVCRLSVFHLSWRCFPGWFPLNKTCWWKDSPSTKS